MWYVYVLLCSDNSFYCGITTNIERRLKQHNGIIKGGAKYTRGRRPCKVIYTKKASDRSDASKKECLFKKLSRKDKEKFLLNINYSSESSSLSEGSELSSQSSPSAQSAASSVSAQPSSSDSSSQSSS